jgi:hypothetical protein
MSPEQAVAKIGLVVPGAAAGRDEDGCLLRIVATPVPDRPAVFAELIGRHGLPGLRRGPASQ